MNSRRSLRSLVGVTVAACGLAVSLAAQAAYPDKPVRLVIPYPAGGTQDAMMRALQERFLKVFGQTLVIDNKAGAAGVIGMQDVARSAPDGYTIGLANNGMVITPLVQSSVSAFDLGKDFAPITLVATGPLVMFAHPKVPGNDVKSLVAYAKTQPEGLAYSSTGLGGLGHLTTELLAQKAGIKLTHVPYKGNAPAMLAVLSGEVNFIVSTSSDTAVQNVQAKKLKAMGVTTRNASPVMPGVVPFSSAVPGFDVAVFFGLVAPRGTPPEIIGTLNKAFAGILEDAEVKKRYEAYGLVTTPSTPAAFSDMIQQESAVWLPIVREKNIKVD